MLTFRSLQERDVPLRRQLRRRVVRLRKESRLPRQLRTPLRLRRKNGKEGRARLTHVFRTCVCVFRTHFPHLKGHVQYSLRRSLTNLRWVGRLTEIAKMPPAGDQTHDQAATLKKLRRSLGCRVTAITLYNQRICFSYDSSFAFLSLNL